MDAVLNPSVTSAASLGLDIRGLNRIQIEGAKMSYSFIQNYLLSAHERKWTSFLQGAYNLEGKQSVANNLSFQETYDKYHLSTDYPIQGVLG